GSKFQWTCHLGGLRHLTWVPSQTRSPAWWPEADPCLPPQTKHGCLGEPGLNEFEVGLAVQASDYCCPALPRQPPFLTPPDPTTQPDRGLGIAVGRSLPSKRAWPPRRSK